MGDAIAERIAGVTVSAIVLDSDVVLVFGDSRRHRLRVEAPLDVRVAFGHASIAVKFDPYSPHETKSSGLDVLATVIGKKVTRCEVGNSGDLTIEFDDGVLLHVGVNEKTESWTFDGDDGIVVSLAGGEVTSFSPPPAP
jgi:hypothetical protein